MYRYGPDHLEPRTAQHSPSEQTFDEQTFAPIKTRRNQKKVNRQVHYRSTCLALPAW